MAEILSLDGKKMDTSTKVLPGKFEFHLFPSNSDMTEDEKVEAEGYLKFGPQFIAVVDGPEDTSNVVFATATQLVRHLKRVSEDGSIEGTLSPHGS